MIRTQLQAVSTTTGAGKLFAQLAINSVITHTLNVFLYIAGPFRCISPAFCRGDGGDGVLFGSLLIGFGFCLTGAASMTNAKRASDNRQQSSCQTNNHFNAHKDLTPEQI
jgi:hypothetical protein